MTSKPSISLSAETGCLVLRPCVESPHVMVLSPDNLTVYVSPAGDDSRDGATPATAVQTLHRGVEVVNTTGWNLTAQIRLLPGTYAVPAGALNILAPYGRQMAGALRIVGDSLDALYPALSVTGVAGGGDVPYVLGLGAPVTPAADGCQASFLTGALAGRRFIVGDTSGPGFSIMYSGAPAPAVGDILAVLAPNASISVPGGLAVSTPSPVAFADLDFVIGPSYASLLVFLGGGVFFFNGVRFRPMAAGTALVEIVGRAIMGLDSEALFVIPAGGAGVAFLGVPATSTVALFSPVGANVLVQNSLVQDGGALLASDASFSFSQGLCRRCGVTVGSGGGFQASQVQFLEADSSGTAVFADVSSDLILDHCDVSACAGDGVRVQNARLTTRTVTTNFGPNGGVGLNLVCQAQGWLSGQGGGNTLTGAGGDVIVGANPAVSWATILSTPAARSDFGAASPAFVSLAL